MAKAAAILEAAKQQISQQSSGTKDETTGDAARHEAEARLREACESGHVTTLQDAIRHAETSGVHEEALAKAREVLANAKAREDASLQLQEVINALLSAISASDVEVLRAAVEHAKSAGVDACILERGQARLAELLEDAARSDAEAFLQAAMATADVEKLAAALEQARSAGVQAPLLLQRAQARLTELLEDAARSEAETALLDACESGDVSAMRLAIARAVAASVNEEALTRAKEALADAEAKEAALLRLQRAAAGLLAAMASADVEGLRAALQEARTAGIEDSLLQRGQVRLTQLLEDEARSAALLAIQEACESGNTDALTSAITQAEKTGVDENSLARARVALAHARDKEASSLLLQEAIDTLLAAISAGDTYDLEAALQQAKRAHVDACLLQRGQARLKELANEVARSEAEAALSNACQYGDVSTLVTATARAEAAAVSEEALATAKAALADRRDKEAALREITEAVIAALAGSDVGVLSRLLEEARAAGADKYLLRRGQERIIELLEEGARHETMTELCEASSQPRMTPSPRVSPPGEAFDSATHPQHGSFPRDNLEMRLRQEASENEGWHDEFAKLHARRPSDAQASTNLSDVAMPAKRANVMAGQGTEDLAFSVGAAKNSQQGKSKKDGATRRDGPVPAMKGKALVDGGTLMLWKNSKTGSAGDSKADAPKQPVKPVSFAARPSSAKPSR